jgi:hypothetical protein
MEDQSMAIEHYGAQEREELAEKRRLLINPHERIEQLTCRIEELETAIREAWQISHYGRGSMQDIDDVLERAVRSPNSGGSEHG